MRRVLVAFILGLSIFSFSFLPVHASNVSIDTAQQWPTTCAVGGGNQNQITVSTSNANDVIFILIYQTFTGKAVPIIADNQFGLAWTLKSSFPGYNAGPSTGEVGLLFWAYAAQALASDVITITGCFSNDDAMMFAISGLPNPKAPFDPNIPASTGNGQSASNTNNAISINIPSTYDMVIGLIITDTTTILNTGPGYTLILKDNGGNLIFSSEYQLLTNPAQPLAVTFGEAIFNGYGMYAFALCTLYPCGTAGGRSTPSVPTFQSVSGPGGIQVPPQLADQGVLGLMGIVAGIILLSAIPTVERRKKRKDSFV